MRLVTTTSPDLQDSLMESDFEEGTPLVLSTFRGRPGRGGWIPIYTKYEYGAPIITDWLCPCCMILVGPSRTCPHCSLAKQEIPIYKDLSRPEREHKSNYKLWMVEELKAQDVRRITRGSTGSQPKAIPEPRPDQATSGQRREARATTRY